MNGGGMGLGKRNFDMLERAGVIFHYETAASELIEDKTGRITGVRALTPAGYVQFNGKSILCLSTDGLTFVLSPVITACSRLEY